MNNTTTSPAPTPTPWVQDAVFSEQSQSDRDPVFLAQITTREDENGQCTKAAIAFGRTAGECGANAAFIVRACNAHERLLRACRLLKQAYDNGQENDGMEWSDVDLASEAARAALAEAEV